MFISDVNGIKSPVVSIITDIITSVGFNHILGMIYVTIVFIVYIKFWC